MRATRISAPKAQRPFTLSQLMALAAAGLLGSASVVTNVGSALARYDDVTGKIVGGSIALAVALIAIVGLSAALQAARRREFILSALAALAFVLACGSSVVSALGVIGGARLQAEKSVGHVEGERARLTAERRKAATELAQIAPARSSSEITPELARRLSVPGVDGCTVINGPATRMHCPVISDLQSELARAQSRSAHEGQLARVDAELARLGSPVIVNRDSVALSHVLSTFGVRVDAGSINTGIVVLGVIVLEIGAALSLATANALRPMSAPVVVDAIVERFSASRVVVGPVPAISAPVKFVALPGARQKAEQAILAAIQSGEVLPASVRKLQTRIGATRATTHTAIVSLIAAGTVIKVGDVLRATA